MADIPPIHFFDIASTLPGPSQSWSFNTLKTRLVLNYKRIPYTQSFIAYPDIAPVLVNLSVPPHPEGTPYTLPAIHIPSTPKSATIMDSLPIASYIDQVYPSPPLFPSVDASFALTLAVGKIVGKVASKGFVLIEPRVVDILDPRGREYFIKTRSALFGQPLSEVRPRDAASVRAITDAAKREMDILAQMLRGRLGKKGPFFEGEKPGYADFIVVAFLVWCERVDKEFHLALMSVGSGEFKALYDACLPWVEGQGEEKKWEVPR
ncbi:hypothetical protein AWENTII_012532 [Aspergillus wentii]|nr:hypothetical protein MW887_002671 [Aspergillus wentii]